MHEACNLLSKLQLRSVVVNIEVIIVCKGAFKDREFFGCSIIGDLYYALENPCIKQTLK